MKAYVKYLSLFLCFMLFACSTSNHQIANKDRDKNYWESQIRNNSTDEFEYYINNFPNGNFITAAQKGVQENKWALAKELDSVYGYGRYLLKYPNGQYSELAKNIIKNKTTSSIVSEQKNQEIKISNWNSIIELIEFSKNNYKSILLYDALENIVDLMELTFPPEKFNSSYSSYSKGNPNHPILKRNIKIQELIALKKEFMYAIESGKAFPLVFVGRNPSYITEVIIQELAGKDLVVRNAEEFFSGAHGCSTKGYVKYPFTPNQKILPYGNIRRSLTGPIPCKNFDYFSVDLFIEGYERTVSVQVKTKGSSPY